MPMSDKAKEYADKAKPLADKAKPLAEKAKPLAEKAKPLAEKAKPLTEKAKQYAGKAKGAADSAVEKYGDKIPDSVGSAYTKASGAVGKYLPGDQPAEPGIDTDTVASDVDVAAADERSSES